MKINDSMLLGRVCLGNLYYVYQRMKTVSIAQLSDFVNGYSKLRYLNKPDSERFKS